MKSKKTTKAVKNRRKNGLDQAIDTWNPDKVWKQSSRGPIKLRFAMPPHAADDAPFVLIEGDRAALESFAKVVLALAADEDCGYGLSPRGPGSKYFTKDSEIGFYIHRLPCVNELVGGQAPVWKSLGKAGKRPAPKRSTSS